MTNNERAARLAEIFGWEIETNSREDVIWFQGTYRSIEEMFSEVGGLLPWMLRELPKRGYGYRLENMNAETVRAKVCHEDSVLVIHRAESNDPLIALIGAVIAAHAERRAT